MTKKQPVSSSKNPLLNALYITGWIIGMGALWIITYSKIFFDMFQRPYLEESFAFLSLLEAPIWIFFLILGICKKNNFIYMILMTLFLIGLHYLLLNR